MFWRRMSAEIEAITKNTPDDASYYFGCVVDTKCWAVRHSDQEKTKSCGFSSVG